MKALDDFKEEFDRRFLSFLEEKEEELSQIDLRTKVLVEEIRQLVLAGGKRLRPAFCYFGYLACGGKEKKAILKASFALELGQAFAIIHDDIMDNSRLRRGKQTVFKKLGLSRAILVGDFAYVLADEIFTSLPFSNLATQRAKRYFDLLKEEVIAGQYLDVLGARTEAEALKVLEYKTARYSISRPLQIGAALAEADNKFFSMFEKYGIPLGTAFQITDDILGMFGSEEIMGKPVDSDLKEGKRTLLVVKVFQEAGKEEVRKFAQLWGNPKADRADLEWVRKMMIETGALSYCQNLAQKLVSQAKLAIIDQSLGASSKSFLLEVADFVLKRKF
jgi:geranylgeranyl diphosphate synthase type I